MGIVYDEPNAPPKGRVVYDAPPKPAATWRDRLQAVDSGLREGGAYLASMPADALMNVKALTQAVGGTGYMLTHHGEVPSWADPAKDPTLRANAAGAGLTHLMDKNQYTTTQVARPDDTVSNVLHTGATLVPGALAAGAGTASRASTLAQALSKGAGTAGRALATGAAGTAAASGVHALHPFQSEAAENAAESIAGLVGGGATNKLRGGAPLANETNAGVTAAQRQGMLQPSFATNPNATTSVVNRIAKYGTVVEKAEEHNQPISNRAARMDLGLKVSGDPIDRRPGQEFDLMKKQANADYQAAGTAGPINMDAQYRQESAAALARVTPTNLSPQNSNATARREIGSAQWRGAPYQNTFDAADGVRRVGELRALAHQESNPQTAQAYYAQADAIEGAMGRTMASSQNPAVQQLVPAWQSARTRLAVAHSVEDAMDKTGNVQAKKIGGAYADGRTLGDNLTDVAQASNSAQGQGFAVPGSKVPKGGFLGEATASLGMGGGIEWLRTLGDAANTAHGIGGGALPAAAIGVGAFAGLKGTQALARQLALRTGQYQRGAAPGLANGWVGPGTVPLAQGLNDLQQ